MYGIVRGWRGRHLAGELQQEAFDSEVKVVVANPFKARHVMHHFARNHPAL